MKTRTPRFLFGGITAIFLTAVILWFGVLTSVESRLLGANLSRLAELIEPRDSNNNATVSGKFLFSEVKGIPKELKGQGAQFQYRAPDQLSLTAEVNGNKYHLAREGQQVKIFVPHQKMMLTGANDVPRFSNRPDSIDPVELPPFSLPVSRTQLRLLPALVTAVSLESTAEEVIIHARFKPFAARILDLPETAEATFAFDKPSGDLLSLRLQDGEKLNVLVQISDWKVSLDPASPIAWEGVTDIPEGERVSLSHLVKFAKVTLSNLNSRAEPLPAETGKTTVLAHSGKGRLEDHDGTRVLFLKGTPEEMGSQHGELLRKEIRAVTDRILYGIGVGSSFAKGRWFFGEIEEAVSRLHPFTDPRYLREMDALASAAGLEIEESRLSNFFPELFHCSGFALHGSATTNGEMYHGRVLDYMRGVGLEQNAVVMIYQPDQGNAWANVGYAGFIGSVTAMNEKHIAIGEMGGRGEGNWDGKAMAQLMREVMEKANTLDEAVAIMERGPRTCEYYYVISDAKTGQSVGIAATPDTFETILPGAAHPLLPHPVKDTVILSAGDRYEELARRIQAGYGTFEASSARELMSRPVCMTSNIQSVLFAPGSLDFWVANADSDKVASETRYTKYNLGELLKSEDALTQTP